MPVSTRPTSESQFTGRSEVIYYCSCKRCQVFFLPSLLFHPKFWQCSQAHSETLGDGAVQCQELDSMIPVGSPAYSLICPHWTLCTTTATGLEKAHRLLSKATMGSSYPLQQKFKIKIPGNIRDCTAFGNGLVLCAWTWLKINYTLILMGVLVTTEAIPSFLNFFVPLKKRLQNQWETEGEFN